MYLSTNFIAPYVGTDKKIILRNSSSVTVGGFNVCHYQKALTEGKQLWINLADVRLVLDFGTETDAKAALALLQIAVEALVINCAIDSGSSTYIHEQTVANSIWTISHNLNRFPSVTVVDDGDEVILANVTYVNNNIILVYFGSSYTGKAYLN